LRETATAKAKLAYRGLRETVEEWWIFVTAWLRKNWLEVLKIAITLLAFLAVAESE
jgi:hypothetical protein